MCCEAPVLAYYDVRKDVTKQCDASKSAVGAVLLQEGRPIAYASRKLRVSAQLGAKRERNAGNRVQYAEIQGVHSRKNDSGPD